MLANFWQAIYACSLLELLVVFAMLATPAQDSWEYILEGLAAGIPGATFVPRAHNDMTCLRWEGISF